MISDVPLGCLLSGGYDSSLVAAIAQEAIGWEALKTFSIGFYEEEYNEATYAKEVAKHLGTNHKELYCKEEDMLSLIDDIPNYFDEPFADSSQIPTMLVSKLAREDVTVALSGDGGDEFFCGYNVYDAVSLAQKLDKLGAIVHFFGSNLHIEDKLPTRIKSISTNRNQFTKCQVVSSDYIKTISNMMKDTFDRVDMLYPIEDKYNVSNWQVRRMLLDMDTYLPGDILAKVDRSSMRYSLECRCPILDKEVMEYSFRINHNFKYNKGKKKYILKDITHDYIPEAIMNRPKRGFAIPLDKWIRGVLKERLEDYSNQDFLRQQGIFNPENTNSFINTYLRNGDKGAGTGQNYSSICWSFFVFQQWWERWMRTVD